MTKFINNSGLNEKYENKTSFTCFIDKNMGEAFNSPEHYDIVEYLGIDKNNRHIFRAKDISFNSWNFYIGELGDEFNKN